MNESSNQVYVAWDEDPELWSLTFSRQYFQNSRLASLNEVLRNAHHFVDPGGFVDSIEDGELLILSDVMCRASWEVETDRDGFQEKCLYLVDALTGDRHYCY